MNSADQLRITALQPIIRLNEFDQNLNQYKSLFDEYSEIFKASNVICLPEYWNGIRKDNLTGRIHNKSLDYLVEIAKLYSVWVIGGSHLVKNGNQVCNRSHILDPSGHLIGTYDKRHPFGYEQKQNIVPGKNELIWQIENWKASIKICSDLWNIADYSFLIRKQIDLVFSPILTTIPNSSYTNYGRFIWHNLAVIRGKEAAAVVIVSDTAMQPIIDPYWSAGATCIVDPSWRFTNQEPMKKNILTSIPDGSKGIVSVNLSLDRIREQRKYRKEMGLISV